MRPVFRQFFQPESKVFLYPALGVCFRHGQGPVHEVFRRRRPGQHGYRLHAGFDHGRGQVGTAGAVGDAEQFLVRAVAVVRDDARPPRLFIFRCPESRGIRPLADGLVQAVRYGVVKRGAVQTVLLCPGPNVLDKFIERVVFAVVGTQNRDAPAPHEQGEGRFHEFRQIVHEGRLVDDDAPLFRTQGTRLRGQPPHVEAGGKTDAVHRHVSVLVPQNQFFRVFRHHIENLGPVGAIADKGLRHFLIIGKIEGILAARFPAFGRLQSRQKSFTVGRADTAALFPHAHPACVRRPAALVGQQDVGDIDVHSASSVMPSAR